MSEREELLPCPFCGKKPQQSDRSAAEDLPYSFVSFVFCHGDRYSAHAHEFGTGNSFEEARSDAARKWNRRQPPAPVQVTGEMTRIAVQTYSRCKAFPDRMSDDDAMQTALCAALQAGVPSGWKLVPEEWRACLEQARLRMLDVEAFKAGRTNILPACEAAIEHANKLLAAAPAPGEGR